MLQIPKWVANEFSTGKLPRRNGEYGDRYTMSKEDIGALARYIGSPLRRAKEVVEVKVIFPKKLGKKKVNLQDNINN